METSIAVKESTAQILAILKQKFRARSMDETIIKVLQKSENIPKSRFGSTPKLKEFSHRERAQSHEL
ncbi:MAG: hypothetical protein AABX85_02705 [Nanoarchaeota archaeon]